MAEFDFLKFIHSNKEAESFILENNISDEKILDNLSDIICYINSLEEDINCGLRLNEDKVEFFYKVKAEANLNSVVFNNITSKEMFKQLSEFDFQNNEKRKIIRGTLNNYFTEELSNNIYIEGSPSSGKTRLLLAIAYKMNSSYAKKIALVNWPGFLSEYRDFETRDTTLLKKFQEVEVLFIDDLGNEAATDFTVTTLSQIISYRELNGLRTIFSSSINLNEYANSIKNNAKGISNQTISSLIFKIANETIFLDL